MPYCEVDRYQTGDKWEGVRLFYRRYGRGATKVLLVIGLAGTHDSWGPQIRGLTGSMEPADGGDEPELAARTDEEAGAPADAPPTATEKEDVGEGIEVCCFDNRGVGRSTIPPHKSYYSTSIMARDALALMDHLGWKSQKELRAPTRRTAGEPPATEEDVEDSDYVPDPEHSSGWAAKLKSKVKKLFCLQTDVQHKMYVAHVDAKKARQQRKAIMRKLEIAVESGSEEVITPEDKWISSYSRWTDSDDSNAGTSAPAPEQEHEEEASEDPEGSEERSDEDSDADDSDESMEED